MMPRRNAVCDGYDDNVFINCPFDDQYLPVFHAVIFAIHHAAFQARCAQENINAGASRFEFIKHLISECMYSVHDISRTESTNLGGEFLPRFNMPLELGVFIGCQEFGTGPHQDKKCLILDRRKYRYQAFISDIAGQDIETHDNDPLEAIKVTTRWLINTTVRPIVGGVFVANRYLEFQKNLPSICKDLHLTAEELTFIVYRQIVAEWLRANVA